MGFKVELFLADLLLEPQLQVGPVSADGEITLKPRAFASVPGVTLAAPTPKEEVYKPVSMAELWEDSQSSSGEAPGPGRSLYKDITELG